MEFIKLVLNNNIELYWPALETEIKYNPATSATSLIHPVRGSLSTGDGPENIREMSGVSFAQIKVRVGL